MHTRVLNRGESPSLGTQRSKRRRGRHCASLISHWRRSREEVHCLSPRAARCALACVRGRCVGLSSLSHLLPRRGEVATHKQRGVTTAAVEEMRAHERLARPSQRVKLKIPWNPRLHAVHTRCFPLRRVQGRRARKPSPAFPFCPLDRGHNRWFIGYLPFYLWAGWRTLDASNYTRAALGHDYCYCYYYCREIDDFPQPGWIFSPFLSLEGGGDEDILLFLSLCKNDGKRYNLGD